MYAQSMTIRVKMSLNTDKKKAPMHRKMTMHRSFSLELVAGLEPATC